MGGLARERGHPVNPACGAQQEQEIGFSHAVVLKVVEVINRAISPWLIGQRS